MRPLPIRLVCTAACGTGLDAQLCQKSSSDIVVIPALLPYAPKLCIRLNLLHPWCCTPIACTLLAR